METYHFPQLDAHFAIRTVEKSETTIFVAITHTDTQTHVYVEYKNKTKDKKRKKELEKITAKRPSRLAY